MSEQVWIGADDAKTLIKESAWGRLKEPNVVQSVSLLDSLYMRFQHDRVVYGMSDTQKALLKFDHYLDRTLDSFCEANPIACRIDKEAGKQFEETALRKFLQVAMDEEVDSEFGDTPGYKVT